MNAFDLRFTFATGFLLAAGAVLLPQDHGAGLETATEGRAQAELGSFGIDLSRRDLSVRPGDDFFSHASGTWLKNFELPADRSRYGAFTGLAELSDERVREIIQACAASDPKPGSIEQKIGDYYATYMNTEALDRRGIEPLRPGLAGIAGIESREDLVRAFGRARIDTTASPFSFFVGADRRDPDRNQLVLSLGGISLPDRDYYLEDSERFLNILAEYKGHITRMLEFTGAEEAGSQAEAVIEVESRIAKILWDRRRRRNRDLTFNPMTYDEFVEAYPGFDWDGYFEAGGVAGLEDLNVSFPDALTRMVALIDEIELDDWKSYLTFQLISNNAGILSQEIDAEDFSFFGTVVNGTPNQRERWERGVARVGGRGLGEAIGQLYVERHFPEDSKVQMKALVESLRDALAESINQISWMTEETKVEAHAKLESFREKIGYPDVWEDLSEIEITSDDLFANVTSIRAYNYQDMLGRLGQPTDREEWGMTPQTVNAYYNSSFNEIVFPAAILQPPFFDPAADIAVNYGGIGGVIGHEMGHGFDDQGSKSDSLGVQRNWWTDTDRSAFDKRGDALVDLYNSFQPIPGQFVDGRFTLGENIGDLGGLSLAYRAYRTALGDEEAPVIDGLTGDQRFFLAWAQVWCSKNREDALVSRLKSDTHSPEQYRVNGIVANMDAWYEAFDVQPDDELYIAPEDRIRIW